jgi:hypothetical protein
MWAFSATTSYFSRYSYPTYCYGGKYHIEVWILPDESCAQVWAHSGIWFLRYPVHCHILQARYGPTDILVVIVVLIINPRGASVSTLTPTQAWLL